VTPNEARFKGLAFYSTSANQNMLFTGNSCGQILHFQITVSPNVTPSNATSLGANTPLAISLKGRSSLQSIVSSSSVLNLTTMRLHNDTLIVTDEEGSVYSFALANAFDAPLLKLKSISSTIGCITCARVGVDPVPLLYLGSMNGSIAVISLDTFSLRCVFGAHTRSVTDLLALKAPLSNLLHNYVASVGEDGLLNIFSLSTSSNSLLSVKLNSSSVVTQSALVGLTSFEDRFFISAYDSRGIYCRSIGDLS